MSSRARAGLLSRELLYTALTRQRERVVVLYQGSPGELIAYANPVYSETAKRLTNLFATPQPVKVGTTFLEKNLIHQTRRGEAVRSKSEVIIADMLFSKGLPDYAYERPLVAADGSTRYPDFTIEDAESGTTVYWEHLGLLHDPVYRERWERKLGWYRDNGVLPLDEGGGQNGTLVVTNDEQTRWDQLERDRGANRPGVLRVAGRWRRSRISRLGSPRRSTLLLAVRQPSKLRHTPGSNTNRNCETWEICSTRGNTMRDGRRKQRPGRPHRPCSRASFWYLSLSIPTLCTPSVIATAAAARPAIDVTACSSRAREASTSPGPPGKSFAMTSPVATSTGTTNDAG